MWQSNCEASKRGKKSEGHSRLDKDKPWRIWWEQYISIPALNGRPGTATLAKLSLQLPAYGGRVGAGESQTHVLSHFLFHLSTSLLSGSKTFIETQKDVHFTNHFTVIASFFKFSHTKCHWCWKTLCFFLNQNCKEGKEFLTWFYSETDSQNLGIDLVKISHQVRTLWGPWSSGESGSMHTQPCPSGSRIRLAAARV